MLGFRLSGARLSTLFRTSILQCGFPTFDLSYLQGISPSVWLSNARLSCFLPQPEEVFRHDYLSIFAFVKIGKAFSSYRYVLLFEAVIHSTISSRFESKNI